MAGQWVVLVLGMWAGQLSVASTMSDGVKTLPSPQYWVEQMQNDLLPWWRQPAALGQPVGRFPTFRCADGRAWVPADPCAELLQAPKWIKDELGREYVRMQSRQVFTYAMGFHLTGDPQLLAWAKAGLSDIRQRALDPRSGSPASWYENGVALPPVGERTAQDIAYAGLAFASVYYLTRDPAILADLDRIHQHLMTYYDHDSGQLRWTLAGPDKDKQELVAQLDPLNAYLVLITPLTRGERRLRWQTDMRRLAAAIRTQYCAGFGPRCQGTLKQGDSSRAGARHNDFGHSGKALWMLGLVARQLHDPGLRNWADSRAAALLQQAYIESSGSWASRWRDEGVEASKSWWIYAELDQLASTLALQDASYAQYLQHSWPWWTEHLVDRDGHEVWGWVSAAGYPSKGSLKQHHWKNGYHSTEHAVISYLTSSALHGQPATLYFADAAATAPLSAYVLGGRLLDRRRVENGIVAARFELPRPPLAGKATFDVAPPQQPLPSKGARRSLTVEQLPQLSGRWLGQWFRDDASQQGACEWTIKTVTADRIEAQSCTIATGGDINSQPLAGPARIRDGELQMVGPTLDTVIKMQFSELDGQLWLQWKQPGAGGTVLVQMQKIKP